jgi:intergrase/recombinase
MSDYEQHRIECARIRKSNEALLAEFAEWLQASGLSSQTISDHVENVDFYINEYLLYEEPVEPQDGIRAVDNFLGYWFIRKAMWASESSIKSNAASLKKFYTFLHSRGLVSQKDLDDLKRTIKDEMPEWLATVARYNDPSITDMDEVWEL